MVDGLSVGGSAAATDFVTIVYQLRMLGFNAVRLPFRWRDMDTLPKDYSTWCSAASPVGGVAAWEGQGARKGCWGARH